MWGSSTFGTAKFCDPPSLFIYVATEASNLKFVIQLVFGSSMPKQLFGPKLAGVWARGASPKFWDPLLTSATIEAMDFKFGV